MGFNYWLATGVLGIAGLAIAGLVLLVRSWPASPQLSAEERADMAGAPMPPLQKRAWVGLSIAVITTAVVTYLVASNGAAEYWVNDQLRLTVMMIFIGGLIAWAIVPATLMLGEGERKNVDERDRAILARAPMFQQVAILLALAAWLISLTQRFHDEGAVPVVYLYLLFGSIILVNMMAQSLGVLLGYWLKVGNA
ncbi:MAG: hypothetical protein PVJ49_12980 [Acidobacteriota bacterium]|jgi:uncharacterized membrane protein YozB (DUF420 family)